MGIKNVHKQNVSIVSLPKEAISEDRGLSHCDKPQLVVASLIDSSYHKNDRTSFAFKFDEMTVELVKDGVTIPAPGIPILFPYQSDAVGFCIDWRQVEVAGVLQQGCYRVKINWEKEGQSGWFWYGSYNLLEYSVFNVRDTVRIFVVLNDLVRKQGINYKDSGFAGTIRFKGFFGNMQPNYDTENLIYTDRLREKVRNEAIRTYELRSDYILYCMTRLIDEEHLLAANQIYITDHNATNHRQDFYDFPVILSDEESPKIEYTGTVYASISALFLEKVQVSESKYDGNIKGSSNIILDLPTGVMCNVGCDDGIAKNSNETYSLNVPSGGVVEIPDTIYEIEVDGVNIDNFQLPTLEDSTITINLI